MPTLRPRNRQSEAPAAAASPSSVSNLRERTTRSSGHEKQPLDEMSHSPDESRPLLDGAASSAGGVDASSRESLSWARRNQWIVFAVASGGCAAFNGVFAKLTTTELTTRFSLAIARMLGLESVKNVIEYIMRGTFFGLNLTFNGVMWTLFTTALARGNSTTQVSIINTSSNFVITAILGLVIFSESLPPLWWLGAALLVAGNVIVGRKDEGATAKKQDEDENGTAGLAPGTEGGARAVESSSGASAGGAVATAVKDEDVGDSGEEQIEE